MDGFPSDALLQAIAAENNLAETAFLVREDGNYRIRWFTPTTEVPLCGHATLASAAVVMERLEPGRRQVTFHSASGPLSVIRSDSGYIMNFPARFPRPVPTPHGLTVALGSAAIEVVADATNYLALLDSARTVRELTPDISALAKFDRQGVIVTAAGDDNYDIVSRYFAPAIGIPEDPVTGGAHCGLAPYWANRLNRTELRAYQASKRGGEMVCRLKGDRVELEGAVVFYLQGEVNL